MAQSSEIWSPWTWERWALGFCAPFPGQVYGTDLLEQNPGASVLHFLSAKRSEKDASIYHVSPIIWSSSLLFCVLDTVIPRISESELVSQQTTMPGGTHLSSHGKEGLRASTGWLSPWHRDLVFFGREEVTICLQAPASWPSPKEALLYPSLEASGIKRAGKLLAATWHLQNATLFFFQVLRERVREVTRPLLLDHREIKSALLHFHS